MADIEMVMNGLECCSSSGECDHCRYSKMNNSEKGRFAGCYQLHIDALELIKEQLPVHCKDCRFYRSNGWCNLSGIHLEVNDDWFCAGGELKGVEEGKKDFIVTRSITDVEGKPHVETISERELIKCKDCIYYTDCLCWNVPNNEPPRPKEETFFCADGRRKGGDN